MAKNHVLQTSAAQTMLAKMNATAQANFVKEVAARARKARVDADTEMSNKITEIEKTAAEALQKANVLDDFEKGQLESAFAKFLSDNGLQTVLNSMVYMVDGQPYSLASVIGMLVDADKIAKEDFDYSEGYLVAAHYELQDGFKFDMQYTHEEPMNPDTGLPTGDLVFNGAATLRNIPVTEQFILRPRKETTDLEGQPYEAIIGFDLMGRTHIRYDLMPLLQPATGITVNAPDLNADGVIGNPEPAVQPAVETPAEEPPVETPAEEPPVETPAEEPPVETPAEEPSVADPNQP